MMTMMIGSQRSSRFLSRMYGLNHSALISAVELKFNSRFRGRQCPPFRDDKKQGGFCWCFRNLITRYTHIAATLILHILFMALIITRASKIKRFCVCTFYDDDDVDCRSKENIFTSDNLHFLHFTFVHVGRAMIYDLRRTKRGIKRWRWQVELLLFFQPW